MEILAGIFSLFLGLAATELTDWLPRISSKITGRAADRLPSNMKARYREEWDAHLDTIPGKWSKAFVAIGFWFAAGRIAEALAAKAGKLPMRFRLLNRSAGVLAAVFFAPLLVMAYVALKIGGSDPSFKKGEVDWIDGTTKVVWHIHLNAYRSRRVARLVRRAGVNLVPATWDVAAGNLVVISPKANRSKDGDSDD